MNLDGKLEAAPLAAGDSRAVDIPDPSTIKDPSLRFAMTQLVHAEGLRSQSKETMNDIAKVQDLQKFAGNYLDIFRKNQTDTTDKKAEGTGGAYRKMTQKEYDWCTQNSIPLPSGTTGPDSWVSASGWELISKGVQAHIDRLGADTQQKMVTAQDMLGQYNAYTQGANSSVNSNNETWKYVNKGQ